MVLSVYRKSGMHGFTLIEILVVVSIISILARLLLPALQRAREKGREVVCLNNLKQISLSVEYYLQDNNDVIPATHGTQGSPTQNRGLIYPLLNTYLQNPSVFWCPSSGESRQWDGAGAPNGLNVNDRVSYGFNSWGTGWNGISGVLQGFFTGGIGLDPGRKRISEIVAPQELVAAADSEEDFYTYWIGYNNPPASWLTPDGLHHGSSNVLFADGHALWTPLNQLLTTRNIWNADNTSNDYP